MIDIKSRRLELNLTLEDVGKAVGVGKSTVRKWETGYIKNMRTDKLPKLAEVLKLSVSELTGWRDRQAELHITKTEAWVLNAYTKLRNSSDPKDRAAVEAIHKLLGISEQEIDGK